MTEDKTKDDLEYEEYNKYSHRSSCNVTSKTTCMQFFKPGRLASKYKITFHNLSIKIVGRTVREGFKKKKEMEISILEWLVVSGGGQFPKKKKKV